MNEQFEKATVGEKVAEFVTSIRTVLVAVLIIFVAVIAVAGIFAAVTSKANEKGLADIDSISYNMTNDSASLSDEDLTAKGNAALASLAKYTGKNGVAGVRANMLAAEIYFSQKNFEAASKSWVDAAEKDKKAYTAPLAYFNAAVSYENLNDLEAAEKNYRKVISYADFDQLAHAKFSLARVLEAKGNVDEAVAVYTELFDKIPGDNFAKLAKSRLIELGK